MDERRIVEAIFDEVGKIIDLIVAQAEAWLRIRSAGVREPGRERGRGASHGVLRYAGVEVLHHIPDFRERTVVEEGPRVLELTQGQGAELERLVRAEGDILPPDVLGVVGEAV